MGKHIHYLGIGEEADRGTPSKEIVGFVPVLSFGGTGFEPTDESRKEFRGEESALGDTHVRRLQEKWTKDFDIPFFTEAGSQDGFMVRLMEHFFGKRASAQNGGTGQYYHMLYPVSDPYATANLGTKALTFNSNFSKGGTVKNHPLIGGRVGGLTFTQEAGAGLVMNVNAFGQTVGTPEDEVGNPTFASEAMRCMYNHLTCYTGTITRTGTAPNYTDFSFGSATAFCPDNVTITFEDAREDKLRLCGQIFADKTLNNKTMVTVEITIDFEDPASGFSSADEFDLWLASVENETNMFFQWDTGVQAGSGDNHSLGIDLPRLYRAGGDPEFDVENDPIITLTYRGLMDLSTTQYQGGIMVKNTADMTVSSSSSSQSSSSSSSS
jgi:hypothetical protein